MSRVGKAAKATVVVQAFNWIGLILSLVTVPLYLQWLGQERYGLLLTSLALLGYLMFADAGLNTASMILIAQASGENDREKIGNIFRNSCTLALTSVCVVLFILAPFLIWPQCPMWIAWLPSHPEFRGLGVAVGLSAIVSLLTGPVYNLMIGMQDSWLAAILQGISRIFGTILALIIASLGYSVGIVYGGNVAAAFVIALFAMQLSRKRYPWIRLIGSYWQRDQIRQQFRTGLKCLVGRAGTVIAGTAPVLAISSAAGVAAVPFFSIPLTLLNAPLSVFNTFAAVLQPGIGEAKGQGHLQWIAETTMRLRRQLLLVLGCLGCGFLLLAGRFIFLWTGGELSVPQPMLVSVLVIISLQTYQGIDRFVLTGMNLHRGASIMDFACGATIFLISSWVVTAAGASGIGLAFVLGSLSTIGWFFPFALRRHLRGERVHLPWYYWIKWITVQAVSYTVGWWMLRWTIQMELWAQIFMTGGCVLAINFAASWILVKSDVEFGLHMFLRRVAKTATNAPVARAD